MSGVDIFLSFALLKPLQPHSFHYSQRKGVPLSSTKSRWEIGRGVRSDEPRDIWIHHSRTSASSSHATISRDIHGTLMIEDHSRHGSFIIKNSGIAIRIQGPEKLDDGTKVWIGPPGESLSCGFEIIDLFEQNPFLRKYAYDGRLGSGAFGDVSRVFTRADPSKLFAVKVLDYGTGGTSSRFDCLKEIELLRNASNHPGICSLLENFHDTVNYKFFLVLEYMPCGNLASYYAGRQPATLAETRTVMKQMSDAVAHLHDHNITHRDLKPDNVLVKSLTPVAEFVISDLGLAQQSKSSRLHTRAGTPLYMAPEIFQKGGDFSGGYTSKVDCWGLALTGFHILVGINEYPWAPGPHSRTSPQLNWDMMQKRKVGKNVEEFFRNMLCVDPDRRWSMSMALESAWLSKAPAHPDPSKLRLQETTPLARSARPPALPATPVQPPVVTGPSINAVIKALQDLHPLPPLETAPHIRNDANALIVRRSPRLANLVVLPKPVPNKRPKPVADKQVYQEAPSAQKPKAVPVEDFRSGDDEQKKCVANEGTRPHVIEKEEKKEKAGGKKAGGKKAKGGK